MTPAVQWLKTQGVEFELHPFANAAEQGYGIAAAEALGVPAAQVFKTLMVQSEKGHACMIVPADRTLNLKLAAKAWGAKKASMADIQVAERITGYRVGGISAFGQKRRNPTWIDRSALEFSKIYVSAGQRGLDVSLNPKVFATLGIHSELLADG